MADVVKAFATQEAWRKWLHTNHAKSAGLWIKFFKKASGKTTVVYKEALEEALCYGWIDGQMKSLDETAYVQRFTPRRPKSNWSQINREHVARLTKEGRMQPAGLREVERAEADGRWDAASAPPSRAELPDDFVAELAKPKNKKAKAYLATLPRWVTYGIFYRMRSAKKP